MNALDWIGGTSASTDATPFPMPHAPGVQIQRRIVRPDPISGRDRPSSEWTDPEPLVGADGDTAAYVADSGSNVSATSTREQVTDRPTLVCPHTADVRVGDRILAGGHVYLVEKPPRNSTNPFTGWRAPLEVPLKEVVG